MPETTKGARLAKVAREINLGIETIAEHLRKKGFEVDAKPTTKLTAEMYNLLKKDFNSEIVLKQRAEQVNIGLKKREKLSLNETGEVKSVKKEQPPVVEQPVVKSSSEDLKNAEKLTSDLIKSIQKEEPKAEKPPVVEAKKGVKVVKEATPTAEKTVKNPVVAPKAPVKKEEPIPVVEAKTPPTVKETPPPPTVKKDETPLEKIEPVLEGPKVVGKIDLNKKPAHKVRPPKGKSKKENPPKAKEAKKQPEPTKVAAQKPAEKKPEKKVETEGLSRRVTPVLEGPKILGKITLPVEEPKKKKGKRKRITRPGTNRTSNKSGSGGGNRSGNNNKGRGGNTGNRNNKGRGNNNRKDKINKPTEVSAKDIKEKIKATMAKINATNAKSSRQKIRKSKRDAHAEKAAQREAEEQTPENQLQVTEFITVSELASLMEITPAEIISACMSLGSFVSINQRLDAEIIDLVCEEFGYEVSFISVSDEEEEEEIVDDPKDLKARAPIVTIMGHVDHGKTSLLDYIRSANVIGDEMGGITQHIGAYEVKTESGKSITFLDTPGHEAFTAMRARGAKVTDIAVIVIAADDAVMPQTKEAISHAQAAGVPIIFAFNKIDRDAANPDRIRQQLSSMNLLVEDWGGKYGAEEISAKTGKNVDELLERILLEAEMLELKANPDRQASGSVIEAELDKGRGYVSTVLVQSGTLKIGDMVVAGANYGKVKAMYDERGGRIKVAGPATPVQLLGLNGAPTAGEKFKVYESEQEAKGIASRREQIMREQGRRTKKHITLDEIGRRLALDSFKELNLIIKGDVDGSVEALSDSLLKLSTEEIQINVIHKSVGQISESDVLLATASDAIIMGFQVRPSLNARRLAEKEEVEIRMYSIIYAAIEEIQSAMEGMLEPTIEEKILCNIEVLDVFKINKNVIAGCLVQEGKIFRNTKVRLVRDGIVKYSGELGSLKRFKDDAKEVSAGMECGLTIKNYNDIKKGDIVEGYEEIEIKRTLGGTK